MRTRNLCAVAVVFSLAAGQSYALIIDGDLSDWGVVVSDNNASTFNFPANIGLLGSHLEDQGDNDGNSAFLGPNRGGQNYDAEAMAVAQQNGTLYVMLVTGQRPDNGFKNYAPGDLRIITNAGTYGLELGGGKGGGAGTAIFEGDDGSTFTMKKSGFTKKYADADDDRQTAGSLWKNATWLLDPIAPKGPVQFAVNGASTKLGMADYVFTRDTVTTQHSIIELSIPLQFFSGETIQHLSWRPSCGNDELDVTVIAIPEPATLPLLALSLLPLARRRRRSPTP